MTCRARAMWTGPEYTPSAGEGRRGRIGREGRRTLERVLRSTTYVRATQRGRGAVEARRLLLLRDAVRLEAQIVLHERATGKLDRGSSYP